MRENLKYRNRPWLFWGLVLSGALLFMAAIGWNVMQRASRMQGSMEQVGSTRGGSIGSPMKAIVRVDALVDVHTIAAEVLERQTDSIYAGTHAQVRVVLANDAAFVMGHVSDIKPGAIIEAIGTRQDLTTLRAARIVILTGYVHLAPAGSPSQ